MRKQRMEMCMPGGDPSLLPVAVLGHWLISCSRWGIVEAKCTYEKTSPLTGY